MKQSLNVWVNSTLKNYKSQNTMDSSLEKDLLVFLDKYPKSIEFLSVPAALLEMNKEKISSLESEKNRLIELGKEKYMDFSDNWGWFQIVNKHAFKSEGKKMKNCVGIKSFDSGTSLFVLQDEKGKSILHLHYSEASKQIIELKGAANTEVPLNLYSKIRSFLESKGAKSTTYKTKDWIVVKDQIYFFDNLPEELHLEGSLDLSLVDLSLIKWPKKIITEGTVIINAEFFKGDIPSFIQADTLKVLNYQGNYLKGDVRELIVVNSKKTLNLEDLKRKSIEDESLKDPVNTDLEVFKGVLSIIFISFCSVFLPFITFGEISIFFIKHLAKDPYWLELASSFNLFLDNSTLGFFISFIAFLCFIASIIFSAWYIIKKQFKKWKSGLALFGALFVFTFFSKAMIYIDEYNYLEMGKYYIDRTSASVVYDHEGNILRTPTPLTGRSWNHFFEGGFSKDLSLEDLNKRSKFKGLVLQRNDNSYEFKNNKACSMFFNSLLVDVSPVPLKRID